MKLNIDSLTVELPCPHCGQKSGHTIRQLKTETHLVCGSCGVRFELDRAQTRAEIARKDRIANAEINKANDKLRRTLSRLGK